MVKIYNKLHDFNDIQFFFYVSVAIFPIRTLGFKPHAAILVSLLWPEATCEIKPKTHQVENMTEKLGRMDLCSRCTDSDLPALIFRQKLSLLSIFERSEQNSTFIFFNIRSIFSTFLVFRPFVTSGFPPGVFSRTGYRFIFSPQGLAADYRTSSVS